MIRKCDWPSWRVVCGRQALLLLAAAALCLSACGASGFGRENEASGTPPSSEQSTEESPDVIVAAGTLPPPIIAEASHTPVPATNTPEATATPDATSTPESTEIPPTDTPPPAAPTSAPLPTNPPPPPPTETSEPPPPPPPVGANGLVASHFALQDRSEYTAGGSVWFEFTISNTTSDEVPYNALGVMPKKDGVDRFEWYQQTYGGRNSTIDPGGLSWEDRIKLPEPGSYTLRLVICFDGFDNCLQGGGTWHSMSEEVPVQIN